MLRLTPPLLPRLCRILSTTSISSISVTSSSLSTQQAEGGTPKLSTRSCQSIMEASYELGAARDDVDEVIIHAAIVSSWHTPKGTTGQQLQSPPVNNY
uniref:Uncharacterized protein n=1 Tax=Leersia perrieri TaxID=77586 RepID=A0A0D9VKH0_9ORYZ